MKSKLFFLFSIVASTITYAQAPVALNDFSQSPSFKEARLKMAAVTSTVVGDSVKLTFNFEVKNYQLKNQTEDAAGKMCSNSDKGQHIHFIIDNKPYVALYEPKYEVTVAKNTEHFVLCFLSRSYHESIKHKGASVLYHFTTDENGNLKKLNEPKTPMVFFSRPKGDYYGKDVNTLLFDFYLWNTILGKRYQIQATINSGGKNTTMTIDKWQAYSLENLALGKNTLKLTLINNKGEKVAGPQTEVSRDFNLLEQEGRK